MNRHQQREKLMQALYSYLLVDKQLADVLDELHSSSESTNEYYYDVCEVLHEHEEEYASFIAENVQDWDYDRLGYVERAILLLALSEYKGLHYDKAIVINEAVVLAKTYCDEDTYKLINGVLDKA